MDLCNMSLWQHDQICEGFITEGGSFRHCIRGTNLNPKLFNHLVVMFIFSVLATWRLSLFHAKIQTFTFGEQDTSRHGLSNLPSFAHWHYLCTCKTVQIICWMIFNSRSCSYLLLFHLIEGTRLPGKWRTNRVSPHGSSGPETKALWWDADAPLRLINGSPLFHNSWPQQRFSLFVRMRGRGVVYLFAVCVCLCVLKAPHRAH